MHLIPKNSDPHGESSADWTFIEEKDDYSNHPLWPRGFDFGPKGHYQWNDPLHKFNIVLEKFGVQLSSVVLDTGYDKLSLPLSDLRRILELTPNLQCLFIKGVNVIPSDSDSQILPSHFNLKSIKIVYSSTTRYLLQAYHHQVETLQLLNIKLSWYSYFEALQWSNSQTQVFGNLRHLKLGEFTSASEFDNFTRLLCYLPDYWKNWNVYLYSILCTMSFTDQ